MKLSDLMKGHTPDPSYEGFSTADDFVLAVDFSGTATGPDDYVVAQEGITEHSGALNPQTQDSQYIRGGQQTMKTGNQRAFKATGDRYIGDKFQDFAFSHAIKFGTGNSVVVPYVYFNILTGKGEKGNVSIIVNSDGSGNAGESSGIDIDLKKTGAAPTEYTYVAS